MVCCGLLNLFFSCSQFFLFYSSFLYHVGIKFLNNIETRWTNKKILESFSWWVKPLCYTQPSKLIFLRHIGPNNFYWIFMNKLYHKIDIQTPNKTSGCRIKSPPTKSFTQWVQMLKYKKKQRQKKRIWEKLKQKNREESFIIMITKDNKVFHLTMKSHSITAWQFNSPPYNLFFFFLFNASGFGGSS